MEAKEGGPQLHRKQVDCTLQVKGEGGRLDTKADCSVAARASL